LALTDACVLDEALDVGGDVSDGEGSLGFEGEEVIMQHGFDYSVWGLGGMVKNCGGWRLRLGAGILLVVAHTDQ
jgi:hypothetical protein